MNKYFIPIIATLFLIIEVGCRKDQEVSSPKQAPDLGDDVRTVLLKEVTAQGLPNPYYFFTYDSLNYVKQIDFGSGFFNYDVEYDNKRVKKITNTNPFSSNNFILYSYINSRVTEINEFSGLTGQKIFTYQLSYNLANQLSQLLWFKFSNLAGSDTSKKAVLTYLPDGNLSTIDYYYTTQQGLLKWSFGLRFSDYDDKVNVDDFRILKQDFFETFLFLPQVKLQKNNPRKMQMFTIERDFEILYSYNYQGNLPVNSTAIDKQVRGPEAGRILHYNNGYAYY